MQHGVRAMFTGAAVTEIVLHHMGAVVLPHSTAKVQSAIDLWLANQKSDNTRRAYRREIQAFAVFVGWKDEPEVVAV